MKVVFKEVGARDGRGLHRWIYVFKSIKPGYAAVLHDASEDEIRRCRTALSHHRGKGRFLDLYTYREDGVFHIARDIS